jgi:AraC-like DNA-binding protein
MSAQVRSASLTGFAELARTVGLDPNRLLAAVNIPASSLDTPEMMIPARAVGRLLELAAAASQTENFGLRLAATRHLSNLGAVALVAREEPTAGKALGTVIRYQRLLNAGAVLRMDRDEGAALISIVAAGRAPAQARQANELIIGVVFRLLQALLGPAWRPQRVCFVHDAPGDLSLHRKLFGTRVVFGAESNGIVCDGVDLDRPRPGSDASLTRAVRRYLDELLDSQSNMLADKVRETMVALLPSNQCTLDHVATRLGLEPRTLQRRLARESEHFASLLTQVRASLALQYVANPTRPLGSIAVLLGFSELSAFTRWFKTTFHCSPSAHRATSVNQHGRSSVVNLARQP